VLSRETFKEGMLRSWNVREDRCVLELTLKRERHVGAGDPVRKERVMGAALMTAAEVAELLGVPVSWVYEQSRRGRIPTVTLGRYRRYRREAIEAWVEELEGPLKPGAPTRGPNGSRRLITH